MSIVKPEKIRSPIREGGFIRGTSAAFLSSGEIAAVLMKVRKPSGGVARALVADGEGGSRSGSSVSSNIARLRERAAGAPLAKHQSKTA
jgi:hypothetical protein